MPQFRVIIVGAGIAGLSTAIALNRKGHDVTVLERHPACQALGGPVGLGANATRVLIQYGMEDIMNSKSTIEGRSINQRRYDDGTVIGTITPANTKEAYGFPTWTLSRYRLQETLAQVAQERGVKIYFNSLVENIDQEKPAVILKDGAEMMADLIIGADGFRSVIRDVVAGEKTKSISPFSAYNIDIPRSIIRDEPELRHLLDESNFWLGPGKICVGINMPDHGDNMNLCLVSEEPEGKEGEWYTLGDLEKVKAKFNQFEPRVRKMLDMADPKKCYIWRLSEMPLLDRWVSESGKLVIIGDAVHAMLPYTGMGASQGIEDSACIAECVDRANTVEDLPKVLKAFEAIRRQRVEFFIRRGRFNASVMHMPDGEKQKERDQRLANTIGNLPDMKKWEGGNVDDPPSEPFGPRTNAYMTGFNIFDYTMRRLDQILA